MERRIKMSTYKELIYDLRRYFYDTELVLDAADAIEQLVKERDAAINDISISESCLTCNHKNCHAVHGCEWEWRGVQEDEHEAD